MVETGHLFDFNGFTILSNGLEALMGASHGPFDSFAPWKRLEEDGPESVALETMLRATCEPSRFLDLIENFLLFEDARGGLRKVVAKYHQVLGVNRAIEAVDQIGENRGRLGVFWHTQGSGKSLSMVMFAEKVLRRLGGNWTFVVITDRQELDEQIAGTFAAVGALTKLVKDCQAQPGSSPRASGGSRTLCLHIDPQVLDGARRAYAGAVRAQRHHRDHRRGPPQPIRPACR
jgi:type I restriction enzyme R subunit